MKSGESASKFAVLGVLSLKPSSGYDVKQFVEGSIGHFWSESYGRIYPLLKEMTADGLITRRQGEKNSGRPERQVYSVTPRGEAALRHWLEQQPRNESPRSELLLKLFFSKRIGPQASAKHVREKKQLEENKLAIYAQIETGLRRQYATHPELPYWLLTLSFGRHMCQGLVDWCDEALQTLSQLTKKEKATGKGKAIKKRGKV
ncbi:MAG TPA: PadR family transcriptional regulator [Verrucomicrobiae bacterium]|jgi:PadR family transcriptional regulator AphA|nr:PadR family transcriptional regulator [Verrucomicrobiae bacterium]